MTDRTDRCEHGYFYDCPTCDLGLETDRDPADTDPWLNAAENDIAPLGPMFHEELRKLTDGIGRGRGPESFTADTGPEPQNVTLWEIRHLCLHHGGFAFDVVEIAAARGLI